MLIKKNRVWAVVALLTGVIGFSSCLKNDNNITPTRPQAQIWFLNVSNSTVPASFYDNDQKISGDTTSVNFNFYSGYAVYGGPHKFELRKKDGGDSVIASNLANYDSSGYYTFLMYDKPVRMASIKSDLTTADQNKINIRFFNLSPNAGPVDVYIGSEKVDSNRNFLVGSELNNASKFTQLASLSINNSVTIKEAGTATVLASTSNLLVGSFTPGNVYTIYLAGTKGSTGIDKLEANAFPSYY